MKESSPRLYTRIMEVYERVAFIGKSQVLRGGKAESKVILGTCQHPPFPQQLGIMTSRHNRMISENVESYKFVKLFNHQSVSPDLSQRQLAIFHPSCISTEKWERKSGERQKAFPAHTYSFSLQYDHLPVHSVPMKSSGATNISFRPQISFSSDYEDNSKIKTTTLSVIKIYQLH